MENENMKYVFAVLGSVAFVYMIGVFIVLEGNPLEWSMDGRVLMVMCSIIVSSFACAIVDVKNL